MAKLIQCAFCGCEIDGSELARGAGVFVSGEWYCRKCCLDGSIAGKFIAQPQLVSDPGDLAPETDSGADQRISELQAVNKTLIKEVKRLRKIQEEADEQGRLSSEDQAKSHADSMEQVQVLQAEIEQAKQEAAALRTQLDSTEGSRSSEEEAASAAMKEEIAALEEELASAKNELSGVQAELTRAFEEASSAKEGEEALRKVR